MKAFLKNYRQSPRKVRLVTGLIKGKRVAEAFIDLGSLPKRASGAIEKLLASAVANAKNSGISEDNLYIDSITVNKGIVLKRSRARARGSAFRINKRTSHITISLKEKTNDLKTTKKVEAKEVKKVEDKKTKEKQTENKKVETKKTEKKSSKIIKKEVKSKTIKKEAPKVAPKK